MLLNQLEGVQAGLLEQFLTHVWAPKLPLVVTDPTDKKICQVSWRVACADREGPEREREREGGKRERR